MTIEELIDKTFVGKRIRGVDPATKNLFDGVISSAYLNSEYHQTREELCLMLDNGAVDLGNFTEFTLTDVEVGE